MKKTIKIRCKASSGLTLRLDQMTPIQGGLKSLSRERFEQLANRLKKGYKEPIGIWKHRGKNYILSGTQRYRVLTHLVDKEGWTCPPLPVNIIQADSMKEAMEDLLGLAGSYGEIEDQELYEFMHKHKIDPNLMNSDYNFQNVINSNFINEYMELDEHGVIHMPHTDIGLAIQQEREERERLEDNVPDVEKNPNTKTGDIWQLEGHRLMCGDSTSVGDCDKLLTRADITFTSPPYNVGKTIRGNLYDNDSDAKTDGDYLDFLLLWTNIAMHKTEIVFHNNQMLESNKTVLIEYQYKMRSFIKDILIWNKKQWPPHINKGTFGSKWEYLFALSKKSNKKSFPCSWQGKYPNVIETENNSSNVYAEKHKAGFPVSYPMWTIEKMDFAKSVYDPFGGTGTTLIACEKTNRKCFMMELDPQYVRVIISRWEQYTGKKAKLLRSV